MTTIKQKHLIASVLFLFIFVSKIIDYSDNSYAASFTAMSEWNLPLPAGNYRITQGDSEDPDPCDRADGSRRSHCSEGKTLKYAIDIAWQGSHDIDQMPLLAPSDGVVYEIGNYGDIKYLSILHPDDGLISHFQHIDTTQIYVQKGQSVERGQCLGRVDTSGTNVAHLHFIILNRENTAGVKITAIDGNSNFTYKDPPNTTIIQSNNRRLEDLNGCGSKAPVSPVIPIPEPMPPPTEPNRPPNKPSLVKPYDMYGSKNSTFELCAQENGDPDKGDYVTGYYFDIYESAQTWDSGWVASNCVTTTPLNPFVYRWRVKVRDTHGQISEWSDVWHFEVQKNGEELPPPEANSLKTPSIISPNESTIFQKSSFILPRDGIHNDNKSIGPMCCTGRTAIVNDANGNPVGYIYFYDFDDAWTLPKNYSIARIMNIMVSGRYLHLPPSQQTMSAITFLAKEMVPGAKKFTNAGDLYYTATIEEAKLENFQDDIYFVMGGVTVRVDVSVTPP